jgi:tRNA G18 (ribose-2'-O)-methylase SpoU
MDSIKQLGHYETLEKMPALDIDCVLYVCDLSSENLGLILRTADVFGVNTVYYHQGQNTLNNKHISKLSRNSSIPIQFSEGTASLNNLKQSGYQIVALEITNTSVPLRFVNFQDKTCLVIGNEQNGIPNDILGIADSSCHIEMVGKHISSLNVSVASSIALYELTQYFIHKKDNKRG